MTTDSTWTPCSHTEARPSLVEQMVMNQDAFPPSLRDWRVFRIEYGFECSCPEGLIFLSPDADRDLIERELNRHRNGTGTAHETCRTLPNPLIENTMKGKNEPTPCSHTQSRPSLVEVIVMRPEALPPSLQGWRKFRIEYGFECSSCPEGFLYLPPEADPQVIEDELNKHAENYKEAEGCPF
jgi:hypothetical protein